MQTDATVDRYPLLPVSKIPVQPLARQKLMLHIPADRLNGRVSGVRGRGRPAICSPQQRSERYVLAQVFRPASPSARERELVEVWHGLRYQAYAG